MVRKLSFKLPSFLMGSFVHDDDDDDDGDDDDGDDDDDDEEEAVTDSIKQLLLRKKCPYSKLFSSAFSRIRIEFGEIHRLRTLSTQCTLLQF